MERDYPLLYNPRPWSSIRVGATSDARWRDLPKGTSRIDMLRAQEMQLEARAPSPVTKAQRTG
jgi:hypothetical protein